MNVIKKIETFTNLRNLSKMNSHNDGTRTIFESVIYPEIIAALGDWIRNSEDNYVLLGGVALSYYVKPRTTTDIDVLFLHEEDIPSQIKLFKKHRTGAFLHKKTNVEVEVLTPEFIKIPFKVAKAIFDTSEIKDGIRIASPSGLVASKLFRFSRQDQADIESLLLCQNIDLAKLYIPKSEWDKYYTIKNDLHK